MVKHSFAATKNNVIRQTTTLVLLIVILGVFCDRAEAVGGVGGGGGWSPRTTASSYPLRKDPSFSSKKRFQTKDLNDVVDHDSSTKTKKDNDNVNECPNKRIAHPLVRGGHARIGGTAPTSNLESTVGSIVDVVSGTIRTVLPPTVAFTRSVTSFYSALPKDAILAQAGLVYCFAGGYYPTLFAAVQAAHHCGWKVMTQAIDDLTDEATKAIDASVKDDNNSFFSSSENPREVFRRKTMIVLKTVDPVKINQAVGAMYTTWLGVSSVLEKEFARTITLSMTISGYLHPVIEFVLAPPVYMCVDEDYHKWVPVIVGWGCKAAAMSVAWRIQRVLSAATSSIAGGLMFSRACIRMLHKKGWRLWGAINPDDTKMAIDEVVGVLVAGLGLWSQIHVQMGRGFSFTVPFPFNLVTWPFDFAERWIQWQITKDLKKKT